MSITNDTVCSVSSYVVTLVISLTANILIARTLGPSGKGLLSLLGILLFVAAHLGGLGMQSAAIHHLGRKTIPAGSIVLAQILLGIATGVGCALLLFVSTYLLHIRLGLPPALLLPLSVSMVLVVLQLNLSGIVIGLTRIGVQNLLQLIAPVAWLVLLVLFIAGHGSNLTMAGWLWLGAQALTPLCTIWWVAGHVPPVRRDLGEAIRQSLRFGLPAYGASLFWILLLRVDGLFLSYGKGPAALGIYSVSVAMAEVLWFGTRALTMSLNPRAAGAGAEAGLHMTEKATRLATWGVAAGAVVLLAAGGPLIRLAFGDAFAPSFRPLKLLLPGIVAAAAASTIAVHITQQRGKPGVTALCTALGLVLNVALNIVWIPRHGPAGAALASSVAYSFVAVALLIALSKEPGFHAGRLLLPRREDVDVLRGLWRRVPGGHRAEPPPGRRRFHRAVSRLAGGVGAAIGAAIVVGFVFRSRSPLLTLVAVIFLAVLLYRDRQSILSLFFVVAPLQWLGQRFFSVSLIDTLLVLFLSLASFRLLRGVASCEIARRPRLVVMIPALCYLGLSLLSGAGATVRGCQAAAEGSAVQTLAVWGQMAFGGAVNTLSLAWRLAASLLLLFLLDARPWTGRQLAQLRATALVMTAFLGIVMLVEWWVTSTWGDPALRSVIGSAFPTGRLPGTFSWPTQLATYLNLTLPLVLATVLLPRDASGNGPGPRSLHGTASWVQRGAPWCALLGLIALCLAMTRGGWAGLIVSAVILWILALRVGGHRRRMAVTGILLVLTMVPLGVGTIGSRDRMRAEETPGVRRGRLGYTWPAALGIIRAHPFSGCGMGTWRQTAPAFAPKAAADVVGEYATERSHAHNVLLHAAAERGIPAAAALAVLLGASCFLLLRRAAARSGYEAWAWVGPAAVLPGFLLHGMFEEVLYQPVFFYCCWALILVAGARVENCGPARADSVALSRPR